MAKVIALLFPFAVYEWITGNKPILSAFSAVFPTVEITMMEPRLGFWRVQGPFPHSIVFGVFCGSIFALTLLVAGTGRGAVSRPSDGLGGRHRTSVNVVSAYRRIGSAGRTDVLELAPEALQEQMENTMGSSPRRISGH